MKLLSSVLASSIFVVLLLVAYFVHARYFQVNVVLYSAVIDAVISTTLTAILLFAFPRFRSITTYEKSQLVVIWLLSGILFAIAVPTVIDRSLSLYILEKLEQRGGGIRLDRFEEVFAKEYVKEHRLVDVRLTEQEQSGTVTIEHGCVRLTRRGQEIARISRYFRRHFLPKQRLLMGEYSDDLTDPFRNGGKVEDYECR